MSAEQANAVVVKDIKMGFGSMVVFLVKWTLAAIPAMIILSLIAGAIGILFGGFFSSVF